MDSGDKLTAEGALTATLEKITAGTLDCEQAPLCRSLLSALEKHTDLAALVCSIFAALGRDADFRDVARECSVLQSIVPLLSSDHSDVRLQAMRAVGNLCIDHDSNREAILSNGGCPYLISQLTRCLDESSGDSRSVKMKCVTCGCILNLTNENEKLQKEFNTLDALSGLTDLLSVSDQDETVLEMALRTVMNLVDQADSASLPRLVPPTSLVQARCVQGEIDLIENVLELLELLINKNDELKKAVVEHGCVDHMLGPMETEQEQKANDIMVTLLADDKCLELMFKTQKVLSHAVSCLQSPSSSLHQKANSALLLANMARSEENCHILVEKGVVPLLISLTKMEETKEMMGKLHHSALSALRNLSLPAAHKQLFLECGVVEAAIFLLKTSSLAHVWFRALGILRLLVDNQAATCSYIVSQSGCVERVCEVCSAVGPAHLQLEGSRLLAAIVKNCHSNEVMSSVVSGGGTKWLCVLLESEHIVMSNEGLVSLNLLAALKNDLVCSALCESDLGSRLTKVLSSPSPEIVSNALLLLDSLMSCDHDQVKSELKSNKELMSSLTELTNHTAQNIVTRARTLLAQF